MKTINFISSENIHAWSSHSGVMISNENTKQLYHADNIDDAINTIYMLGFKPSARELNVYKKTQ